VYTRKPSTLLSCPVCIGCAGKEKGRIEKIRKRIEDSDF
jgi:hypothetical protein